MRRIATYSNVLSKKRNLVGIWGFAIILVNLIGVVVFTSSCSSTPPGNQSIKSANTPLIRTRQVSLHGREYEILTNAQGLTLYYFYFLGADMPKTVCTGKCTATWHPLLTTSPSAITVEKPELQGKLTAVTNPNGLQVQYNGRLLYTYSGDKVPGQMNGDGRSTGGDKVPSQMNGDDRNAYVDVISEIAVYSSKSTVNSSTNSTTPLISSKHVFIHGKGYEVLGNAQGLTLYYPDGDVCTGECTTTWHPLLLTDPSAIMTVSPELRDLLAAVPGPNGLQVQYIGHFLYTYSGDQGSGDVNGLAKDGWMFAH